MASLRPPQHRPTERVRGTMKSLTGRSEHNASRSTLLAFLSPPRILPPASPTAERPTPRSPPALYDQSILFYTASRETSQPDGFDRSMLCSLATAVAAAVALFPSFLPSSSPIAPGLNSFFFTSSPFRSLLLISPYSRIPTLLIISSFFFVFPLEQNSFYFSRFFLSDEHPFNFY